MQTPNATPECAVTGCQSWPTWDMKAITTAACYVEGSEMQMSLSRWQLTCLDRARKGHPS